MKPTELNAIIADNPPAALVAAVIERAIRDTESSDPTRAVEAMFWLLTAGPEWLALTGFEIDQDLFLDKVVMI